VTARVLSLEGTTRSLAPLALALLLAVTGCGGDWEVGVIPGSGSGGGGSEDLTPPTNDYPQGLRVAGNRIVDRHGTDIVLRGINRSGTEYACIQGSGIFDGPDDEDSVRAMTTWNINAVRVPLNETCWLGINGAPSSSSGDEYKKAIRRYVNLLHTYELIPILELHWAAPGEERATGQRPMPNVDHSPAFWADVAATFNDDSGVIFDPYNEPFLYQFGGNETCGEEAWNCWRDGCTISQQGSSSYEAAGMQALVSAIRETQSQHVILLGGLDWSNCFDGFLSHLPEDPIGNLGASWHIYNFNLCNHEGCWDGAPREVADSVPLVATELGQDNCQGEWVKGLMEWLDESRSGYLAWQWNKGPCVAGERTTSLFLIQDYENVTPVSGYAQTIHDHFWGTAE
jgi:hypothetical protein